MSVFEWKLYRWKFHLGFLPFSANVPVGLSWAVYSDNKSLYFEVSFQKYVDLFC